MKLKKVILHNFRGVIDASFDLLNDTLLVGSNNAGKTSVADALRCCYEKDGYKYKAERDFPYGGAKDKESWIDIDIYLVLHRILKKALAAALLSQLQLCNCEDIRTDLW